MSTIAAPSSNRMTYWSMGGGVGLSGAAVKWSRHAGELIPTYSVVTWSTSSQLPRPCSWDALGRVYKRVLRDNDDVTYCKLNMYDTVNWKLYRGVWCRIFGTDRNIPGPVWVTEDACWVPNTVLVASVELFGEKIPWDAHIKEMQ